MYLIEIGSLTGRKKKFLSIGENSGIKIIVSLLSIDLACLRLGVPKKGSRTKPRYQGIHPVVPKVSSTSNNTRKFYRVALLQSLAVHCKAFWRTSLEEFAFQNGPPLTSKSYVNKALILNLRSLIIFSYSLYNSYLICHTSYVLRSIFIQILTVSSTDTP